MRRTFGISGSSIAAPTASTEGRTNANLTAGMVQASRRHLDLALRLGSQGSRINHENSSGRQVSGSDQKTTEFQRSGSKQTKKWLNPGRQYPNERNYPDRDDR